MNKQVAFVLSLEGPLDALPPVGKIRAGYLRGLNALILSRGGDARRILHDQQIDPVKFRDPDYHIDCGSAVSVLEYCSASLGDPLFGFHLADYQEPDVFGCVGALARSAPTFGHALKSFVDYLPVAHCREGELQLFIGERTAEVRWEAYANPADSVWGTNDQANLHSLLLRLKFISMLGGKLFRPSYANSICDGLTTQMQLVADRIGCKIITGCDKNAIGFPVELLDQPVMTSDRVIYSLLGNYLGHIKAATAPTVVEQVEAFLRGAIPSGHCTIGRCADKLGMSVRTLQKRLSTAGVGFADLVEIEREKMARQALSRQDCTLDEVALHLGYSDQSSFGRAFKRWTGATPQMFRERRR